MAHLHYCREELRLIRTQIASSFRNGLYEGVLHTSFGKEKPHLAAFFGLQQTAPDLFAQIDRDPRVERLKHFMFFPAMEFALEDDFKGVPYNLFKSGRGLGIVFTKNGKSITIMPTLSEDEHKISTVAGELGIGQNQHETIDGFLTQDSVSGIPFPELILTLTLPQTAALGRRVTKMLHQLHSKKIRFNCAVFDIGVNFHLYFDHQGIPKLSNFGQSIDCSNYPALTNSQVYRHLLTTPELGERLRSGEYNQGLLGVVTGLTRMHLRGVPLDAFLDNDLSFALISLSRTSSTALLALSRSLSLDYETLRPAPSLS